MTTPRAHDQPAPLTPVSDLTAEVDEQLHRTEDAVAHLRAVRARSHALAHWPADEWSAREAISAEDVEC